MKNFQKKLSENLIFCRGSLSTKTVAKLSGMSETYIKLCESGNGNPSLLALLKLSNALNVEISRFLEGLDNSFVVICDVGVVCPKHGTVANVEDIRYLPTEYAAKYNHCLNCAIEARKIEIESSEFTGYSGTYFSQQEIGLLIGEQLGNVYQIEHKALKKLQKKTKVFNLRAEDFLD